MTRGDWRITVPLDGEISGGNVPSLRPPVKIDQYYICVVPDLDLERYSEPSKQDTEEEPNPAVVRSIKAGDVVHGVLTCYSTDGSFRLKVKDGLWTTIQTPDGHDCLTKANRVDQWYIRVQPKGGVLRVRSGLELCTPVLGSIEVGDLVHGLLVCRSSDGSLRLRLDDFSWTTIIDMDGSECLRKVTKVEKHYVCVVGSGICVRRGVELNSPHVRMISHQEQVKGVMITKSTDGSLRLKLDDGNWTTINDKDGQEGLREVTDVDMIYSMMWPFGGIIGRT